MKKFAYLGLVAMLTISSVGCSKSNDNTESTQATAEAAQTETPAAEEETKGLMLTDKDLEPFVKALYSLTEEDYDSLNEHPDVKEQSYFDNLEKYREVMKKTLGNYLSDETLKTLQTESTKLDFDLPKKASVNNYMVSASGTVQKVEIKSSRQLGDDVVYEVEVTTINKALSPSQFAASYKWEDKVGYYVAQVMQSSEMLDALKKDEASTYIYAQNTGVSDYVRLVNSYWIYVKPSANNTDFKVDRVKQSANMELDVENKDFIGNALYIERIPYYDKASDQEKATITNVAKILTTLPRETYQYYDQIYGTSFNLVQKFWTQHELGDKVTVNEASYQKAFMPNINPYKDQIQKLELKEDAISIKPSIYSTQLQPAFIVTLPLKALNSDNTYSYYFYKYYMSMENGKVEAIQFQKVQEVSEEAFNAGPAGEETNENADQTQADSTEGAATETPATEATETDETAATEAAATETPVAETPSPAEE